jgi:hypothetical protein
MESYAVLRALHNSAVRCEAGRLQLWRLQRSAQPVASSSFP